MSRAAWTNLLLAAAVAALGTWIYLKPADDERAGHALSTLRPTEIASIRVERAGEPAMVLSKKQGAWFLVSPFAARGNELRAQQLLEIAEARSAHRYPAADLGRFELDPPQARLTLAGQTFAFGMVSPVTREQYVLTSGSVYAVSPRYGAVLPAGTDDLLSPRLLGPDEAPVRFELEAFVVEQRDGAWRLRPGTPDSSQDDLVRWVDGWRHAVAARVERPGASRPAGGSVKIRLKDGGELVMDVLARAPELTLMRRDDKVQYTFRGAAAKRMLAPPGATTSKPPMNADERR